MAGDLRRQARLHRASSFPRVNCVRLPNLGEFLQLGKKKSKCRRKPGSELFPGSFRLPRARGKILEKIFIAVLDRVRRIKVTPCVTPGGELCCPHGS